MEKRSSASEQTRQALAEALKELMAQKPIDKITIHDLTERCGIRRQNFYYHFEDVYDLMRWMFEKEAVSLLRQHEGTLLWQEGLLQLFHYLEENRAVCRCALKSVGRDTIRRFFDADIYAIIHQTIAQIGGEISGDNGRISESDMDLTTYFYVTALAGMAESWVLGQLDQTPEELISFADTLLQDHVRGAKLRLEGHENG